MKRGTNRPFSTVNLSRLIRDYYQKVTGRRGLGAEYERGVNAVWEELAELERRGASSAFLLHVLTCTRFGRFRSDWQSSPALDGTSPRQRSAFLRAIRTLRARGEEGVVGLFGLADREWAGRFYSGLVYLEQQLTAGTYETLGFVMGGLRAPGRRDQELYRRAGIACLMRELEGHPKRAVWVASLLEKFELLPRTPGDAVDWIKKRHQRDSARLGNPLSALSAIVEMLRVSFHGLQKFLAPEHIEPIPPNLLRKTAKRWAISVRVFSRRFLDFCRMHRLKPDQAGLREFELALSQAEKVLGRRSLLARWENHPSSGRAKSPRRPGYGPASI